MRGFLFASRTQVNGLRHRTLEYSGSRCFEGVECPFVFSSSAEIPVFCPREQCPLHVFSLESSRVVSSFTVLAQADRLAFSLQTISCWDIHRLASRRNSTKVTVFPKNTWTTLLYLLFLSPSSVLIYVYLVFLLYYIYIFIFLSFFHITPT